MGPETVISAVAIVGAGPAGLMAAEALAVWQSAFDLDPADGGSVRALMEMRGFEID